MILRIDHVAIGVVDYEKAYRFFTEIFGAIPGAYSVDNNMKYRWQTLSMGDLSRFELLTPTGDGSFLDNFLKGKTGGVHHITLQTGDIAKAMELLDKNKIPYFGYHEYGNLWKEIFIHPKDAFGVLIQIAEFRPDDWLPPSVIMPGGKKFQVDASESGCVITFAHPGGGKSSVTLSKSEAEKLASEITGTENSFPALE